ncbi:hypothetical protein HK100_001695, partial [Physocladia obscura]
MNKKGKGVRVKSAEGEQLAVTVTVWLESERRKEDEDKEEEEESKWMEENELIERINNNNNDNNGCNGIDNNHMLRTPLRFVLPVDASSYVSQLHRLLCEPLLDLCSMLRGRSLAISPLLDHLILHIEDLLTNASYRSPLDAELLPSFSLKQCGYLTLQPPLLKVVLFGVPAQIYACLFPHSQSRKHHFVGLNSPAVSSPSILTSTEYDGDEVIQDSQDSVAETESRNSVQSTHHELMAAISFSRKNFATSPIFVTPRKFSTTDSDITVDEQSIIQPVYSEAQSSISTEVETELYSRSHCPLNETEFDDEKQMQTDSLDILPSSPSLMEHQIKILAEATSRKQLKELQLSKTVNQKSLSLPLQPISITENHEFLKHSSFNESSVFATPVTRSLTILKTTTNFASVLAQNVASIAPPDSPAVTLLDVQILSNRPLSQSPKLPASLVSIGRSNSQLPPTMAMIVDDSDGSDDDNEKSDGEKNYGGEDDKKNDDENVEHDEDNDGNGEKYAEKSAFEVPGNRKLDSVSPLKVVRTTAEATGNITMTMHEVNDVNYDDSESEYEYVEIEVQVEVEVDSDGNEIPLLRSENNIRELSDNGNDTAESILREEKIDGVNNDSEKCHVSKTQKPVAEHSSDHEKYESNPNENNNGQGLNKIENARFYEKKQQINSKKEAKIDLEIIEMTQLMDQNEENFGDESDLESSNGVADDTGGHDDDDEIVLKTPSESENESTTTTAKIPRPPLIINDEDDERQFPLLCQDSGPLFSLSEYEPPYVPRIPDTQESQVSSTIPLSSRRGRAPNLPDSQIPITSIATSSGNTTPETFLDFTVSAVPPQPAIVSPPALSRLSDEKPTATAILPHLRYQPTRRQMSGDGFGRLHTTLKDISDKFSFFRKSGGTGTSVNQGGIVTPATTITSTKNSDDSDGNNDDDDNDDESNNSDSDSNSSESSSDSSNKVESKKRSHGPQFAGAEKKRKRMDRRKSLFGLLAKDSEFSLSLI